MNSSFLTAAAVAAAVAFIAGAAGAHSLDSLQQDLLDTEKYFQVKDEPAPDWELEDADGNPVRLKDFRGKVVVQHFIYAGCEDACPLHAEKIGEIQRMVNQTPMKEQVQFITITTDPKRDIPEVLKGYGPVHGLDPTNWVFLTSGPDRPEDTTRKLAEEFGHAFSVVDDETQIHGVVTHVIDPKGQWVANFHGLGFDSTNLVTFINGVINADVPHQEKPKSLWSRILAIF
jgi:protein SCO1/2